MAIRNSWVLGPLLCQKSCFTCTNCLGSIKPLCSIRLRDCLHLTRALLQLHLQRNGSFCVLEHIFEWQSNPELRQEPALPLRKGNIGGPPTHVSFLEVTSYTNTKSSLPLTRASPIPWSVGNGHATAQGFIEMCEQNCSVPASVPTAQQCWALKTVRDAACPWVSCLQCYTSKIPVQELRHLCNDSAHVLPVSNICCFKRHPGLVPPCLSSAPVKCFQHHRGTVRCVWFGNSA